MSATAMLKANARDFELELAWFAEVLDVRFKLYFASESAVSSILEIPPPDFKNSQSNFAIFLQKFCLSINERLALTLCVVSQIRPRILDVFLTRNIALDRPFTEFGGYRSTRGEFIPTIETLVFIIGGQDLESRFTTQSMFDDQHIFIKNNIIKTTFMSKDDRFMGAVIQLSDEVISLFTTGLVFRPDLSPEFPAKYISTQLDWKDLILHQGTRDLINEISQWIQHGDTLMNEWAMSAKLRPGYRSLFYGPPGTGKTMTACLLGKSTGRDVYKIDLSLVVSKYIGETEKNLNKVFEQAQNKGWILFFDEADALFGRRTQTSSAQDRFANQEVSFLLQRIETFDGIAILATNFRDNLDEAFLRRFESIIYFPMPEVKERLQLWQKGFSSKASFEKSVELKQIAAENQLSGGSIMNVIRYCSMQALKSGGTTIRNADIKQGVRRELAKEGNG